MASWWTTSVPGEPRPIDLNADVGEASDTAGIAVERALLDFVTSFHIACGGHAGDRDTMRATVEAARDRGVRVGAHPSYPDREGFGRRPLTMSTEQLSSALGGQIAALMEVAASLDASVDSVKPHGALYGEAGRDEGTCEVVIGVLLELLGPGTTLVLPAGTPAVSWAHHAGVRVLQEGFADRAYTANGELMGRQLPGSVYGDPALAAAQALGLAVDGTVATHDGVALSLVVDTLCVHGDSPDAVAMARAVRRALDGAGVAVAAPPARHP
jgi:5-oxoprolinase (ATP-hydrolysing) subunit A